VAVFRLVTALTAGFLFAGAACAADLTQLDIGSRDTVLGGNYANNTVLLHGGGAVQDKAATREFFAGLFLVHLKDQFSVNLPAAVLLHLSCGVEINRISQDGVVAPVAWNAGPALLPNEHIVKEGEIHV
jgi:hypothetical protein